MTGGCATRQPTAPPTPAADRTRGRRHRAVAGRSEHRLRSLRAAARHRCVEARRRSAHRPAAVADPRHRARPAQRRRSTRRPASSARAQQVTVELGKAPKVEIVLQPIEGIVGVFESDAAGRDRLADRRRQARDARAVAREGAARSAQDVPGAVREGRLRLGQSADRVHRHDRREDRVILEKASSNRHGDRRSRTAAEAGPAEGGSRSRTRRR